MAMLVAILSKEDLERYKNLLREVGAFGEGHHCNCPLSDDDKMACTVGSELLRQTMEAFWVELAGKYGFDNRQALTLDPITGEIRVVPMSPKTY